MNIVWDIRKKVMRKSSLTSLMNASCQGSKVKTVFGTIRNLLSST